MRPIWLALVVSAVSVTAARAAEPRYFEDCTLHAVHFINQKEGWAAGDDGVVWHTLNGGGLWERQKTGTRGSLRSIQFLNFDNGWIVGREELHESAGSVGVLLYTDDGGTRWQRLQTGNLPGLHTVKFVDPLHGFVVGDCTEQDPTGVYQTSDGGHTWKPLPGTRSSGWLAADFRDASSGVLAGAWNKIALVRDNTVVRTSIDKLGARNIRAIQLTGAKSEDGVAVGEGGLVLFSDGASGAEWKWPKMDGLSPDLLASLDFHAVSCVGKHVWIAGRPGSVILHSPDRGGTWELLRTGQPLPLHAIQFVNEKDGWAAGEFGTVMITHDGGKSWQLGRRGAIRSAALCINARSANLPVDALARLGGDEGYLIAALRVTSPDSASAPLVRASDPQRFAAATRLSAGAAGESLWQFPVPQHSSHLERTELMKSWDRLHADQAAEQLLRQLVLAMRMWQPDIIITDPPDSRPDMVLESIVSEAVREAYKRSVDPKQFPEQITSLGLPPCQAGKLYACWPQAKNAQVTLDTNRLSDRLESSPRDFAGPAAALLADPVQPLPSKRCFRLLAASLEGADQHTSLFQDVKLAPGGEARRKLEEVADLTDTRRNAQAKLQALKRIIDTPIDGLGDPGKVLAQLGPGLDALPDYTAAPALCAIAQHFARNGQWTLAREAFLLMVSKYPGHPQTADAYRWLIRYGSSGEARHRYYVGQFAILDQTTPRAPQGSGSDPGVQINGNTQPQLLGGMEKDTTFMPRKLHPDELRQWHQAALDLEKPLTAFGRVYSADPSLQFCLNASRRALGDFEGPRRWCTQFVADHADGPWREAALAELWLTSKQGPPPLPLHQCTHLDEKPYLDGELTDACWRNLKPLPMKDAAGKTLEQFPTQVWLAHDDEFLYLALRCEHPADRYVEPVKARSRDADLRPFDRVTLMLDLDRDFTTTFNLHVDQRGCVADDCWGDATWNPRWFVACKSDKTYWQIEAAIPLSELTTTRLSSDAVWAFNVVRTIPGRGVQAFSIPADATPRPEGMGLLKFEDGK